MRPPPLPLRPIHGHAFSPVWVCWSYFLHSLVEDFLLLAFPPGELFRGSKKKNSRHPGEGTPVRGEGGHFYSESEFEFECVVKQRFKFKFKLEFEHEFEPSTLS